MTELLISAFIKNKDDLKNHKVRQAYGTMEEQWVYSAIYFSLQGN